MDDDVCFRRHVEFFNIAKCPVDFFNTTGFRGVLSPGRPDSQSAWATQTRL
jgi:hypothetical protein